MWRQLCVLPFFVVFAAGCRSTDPLPPAPEIEDMASEIEDMRAVLDASRSAGNVEFTVPREHWSAVTDALLPATRDDSPAKWLMVGKLKIATLGGGRRTVWLFSTDSGPGAFAVGEDSDHRVYYRGGESAKLRRALDAARTASQGR